MILGALVVRARQKIFKKSFIKSFWMTERDLMEKAKSIWKLIFVFQRRVLGKNQRALSNRDYGQKVLNLILVPLVSTALPKIC